MEGAAAARPKAPTLYGAEEEEEEEEEEGLAGAPSRGGGGGGGGGGQPGARAGGGSASEGLCWGHPESLEINIEREEPGASPAEEEVEEEEEEEEVSDLLWRVSAGVIQRAWRRHVVGGLFIVVFFFFRVQLLSELLSEDSSKSERLATEPLVGSPLNDGQSLETPGDPGEERLGGLDMSLAAGDGGDGDQQDKGLDIDRGSDLDLSSLEPSDSR
ncbi:hypothetical protein CRUP_014739 [Coryphaenoides rupestris]|nr:hypothetical protein CRUP_014739 [Coryphaenoides rupestris]